MVDGPSKGIEPIASGDISVLLKSAAQGDRDAVAQLFENLYPELRRIARLRLNRGSRSSHLETTALVHECYLKFSAAERIEPEDRQHFLAYAATAMRSIVVDFARSRMTERSGGHAAHFTLDTNIDGRVGAGEDEVLKVHEALDEIAALDGRLVQVVEMRYFAGMTEGEIAQALGIAVRTVRRDWEKARLLLAEAMSG
jgi:RNA polymerase sigma factor (TIGR02999 family)